MPNATLITGREEASIYSVILTEHFSMLGTVRRSDKVQTEDMEPDLGALTGSRWKQVWKPIQHLFSNVDT